MLIRFSVVHACFAVLVLAAPFRPANAQAPRLIPHVDLGAGVNLWRMDRGTAGTEDTSIWAARLQATYFFDSDIPEVGLQFSLSHAPARESPIAPGLTSVAAELLLMVPTISWATEPVLSVSFGPGLMHFAADHYAPLLEDCSQEVLRCYSGSIGYRSGWRPYVGGGPGISVWLTEHFGAWGRIRLVQLIGSGDAGQFGNSSAFYGVTSFGLSWRW